jgi:hypothetical protein
MLNNTTYQREIAKLLLALDAAPGQAEPSQERLTQLWEDVCHLDDASFVIACERCRKECDWFPKAKHILERARVVQRSTGAVIDGASAWAALESAILNRWSEAGDRLLASQGKRYPWPDDRTRAIFYVEMNLTPRTVATLDLDKREDAYRYDQYRKRFIQLYDEQAGTQEAIAQVADAQERAKLAGGGNVRQIGGAA